MNADADLDAAIRRKAGVAFDHAILHLDGTAHGVDHATKLHETSVAGALHHASVMHGDGRINQITPECPGRANVRSSSAPVSRLYPTTSAASIAASFRVSAMTFRRNP